MYRVQFEQQKKLKNNAQRLPKNLCLFLCMYKKLCVTQSLKKSKSTYSKIVKLILYSTHLQVSVHNFIIVHELYCSKYLVHDSPSNKYQQHLSLKTDITK